MTITFRRAGKLYTFTSIQRAAKTMRRTPEQVLLLINGEEPNAVWDYLKS